MHYFLFVLFFSLSLNVLCENEKEFAVELTPETFDDAIKENNYFIMFFAPWCGHCKRLHPLWEQLAEMMNVKDEPRVVIAKVDCTQHQELCAKHEITGYPTLRFFKLGLSDSKKFQGTRDLPTITDFIQEELGDKEENVEDNTIDHKAKIEATELTDETFMNYVSKGMHFVKFYAPWCSHCQRLAPTWQELAETLKNNENVKISKIDCTQYRPLCQNYEVKGYPTLLWFDSGKKIEKYSGNRDINDLLSYVKKMSKFKASAVEDDKSEKPESFVKILSADNFNENIQHGTVFVKFFAPWCGHCKKLNPIWEELGKKFQEEKKVKIAKVDCTTEENKQLCQDQEVEGFPTLFIYKNGKKQAEYHGHRQLDDLYSYVGSHTDHDEL